MFTLGALEPISKMINSQHSANNTYSGPLKVVNNPFQEAVRLSVCSIFELNFP